MPTICIKRSYELARDAPIAAVYGTDQWWWRSVDGLRKATNVALCISYDQAIQQRFPAIRRLRIDTARHDILVDTPGLVGNGGNGTFQALNLAVQAGADRVLLIGLDLQDRSGSHWYGRNTWQRSGNPDSNCFARWIMHFNDAAKTLEHLKVDVVNASPISALKAFRHASVEATLSQWGIA